MKEEDKVIEACRRGDGTALELMMASVQTSGDGEGRCEADKVLRDLIPAIYKLSLLEAQQSSSSSGDSRVEGGDSCSGSTRETRVCDLLRHMETHLEEFDDVGIVQTIKDKIAGHISTRAQNDGDSAEVTVLGNMVKDKTLEGIRAEVMECLDAATVELTAGDFKNTAFSCQNKRTKFGTGASGDSGGGGGGGGGFMSFNLDDLPDFVPLENTLAKLRCDDVNACDSLAESLDELLEFDVGDLFEHMQWSELLYRVHACLGARSPEVRTRALLVHIQWMRAFTAFQGMDVMQSLAAHLLCAHVDVAGSTGGSGGAEKKPQNVLRAGNITELSEAMCSAEVQAVTASLCTLLSRGPEVLLGNSAASCHRLVASVMLILARGSLRVQRGNMLTLRALVAQTTGKMDGRIDLSANHSTSCAQLSVGFLQEWVRLGSSSAVLSHAVQSGLAMELARSVMIWAGDNNDDDNDDDSNDCDNNTEPETSPAKEGTVARHRCWLLDACLLATLIRCCGRHTQLWDLNLAHPTYAWDGSSEEVREQFQPQTVRRREGRRNNNDAEPEEAAPAPLVRRVPKLVKCTQGNGMFFQLSGATPVLQTLASESVHAPVPSVDQTESERADAPLSLACAFAPLVTGTVVLWHQAQTLGPSVGTGVRAHLAPMVQTCLGQTRHPLPPLRFPGVLAPLQWSNCSQDDVDCVLDCAKTAVRNTCAREAGVVSLLSSVLSSDGAAGRSSIPRPSDTRLIQLLATVFDSESSAVALVMAVPALRDMVTTQLSSGGNTWPRRYLPTQDGEGECAYSSRVRDVRGCTHARVSKHGQGREDHVAKERVKITHRAHLALVLALARAVEADADAAAAIATVSNRDRVVSPSVPGGLLWPLMGQLLHLWTEAAEGFEDRIEVLALAITGVAARIRLCHDTDATSTPSLLSPDTMLDPVFISGSRALQCLLSREVVDCNAPGHALCWHDDQAIVPAATALLSALAACGVEWAEWGISLCAHAAIEAGVLDSEVVVGDDNNDIGGTGDSASIDSTRSTSPVRSSTALSSRHLLAALTYQSFTTDPTALHPQCLSESLGSGSESGSWSASQGVWMLAKHWLLFPYEPWSVLLTRVSHAALACSGLLAESVANTIPESREWLQHESTGQDPYIALLGTLHALLAGVPASSSPSLSSNGIQTRHALRTRPNVSNVLAEVSAQGDGVVSGMHSSPFVAARARLAAVGVPLAALVICILDTSIVGVDGSTAHRSSWLEPAVCDALLHCPGHSTPEQSMSSVQPSALTDLVRGIVVVLSRRLDASSDARTSVVPLSSRRSAVGGGMEVLMQACADYGGPITMSEVMSTA